MAESIVAGMTGEARRTVTEAMTAIALKSGDVPVLGTPALLALMEEAAVLAVRDALDQGTTTVGTWAELEHLAPSGVGAAIRAVARVVTVDGRRLSFEAEAYDGEQLIGRGRHRRSVVARDRFAR